VSFVFSGHDELPRTVSVRNVAERLHFFTEKPETRPAAIKSPAASIR
jgi:hypothetical protein